MIHPDVYGPARGDVREQVVEVLVQSGYDRAVLDQRRVDEPIQRARRGRGSRVDSVLAGESAAGAAGRARALRGTEWRGS